MGQIPAFCNDCNILFSSGFGFEGNATVTMSGNRTSCPKCGEMVPVSDGVFKLVKGSIDFINSSNISLDRLLVIQKELIELNSQKPNFNVAKNDISNDIPELKGIISILPKTRNELYAFLAILIAIISATISGFSGSEQKPVEYNEFIINNYYKTSETTNKRDTISVPLKMQRNEKCHCGSGIKYKFCCGKN